MNTLKSWRALLVREYLEHRIPFIWAPLAILTMLTLAGLSSLGLRRLPDFDGHVLPYSLKVFEIGYLLLLALWLAYLAIAMFFYFGDAFSADRRNNAMLFWKSMPVTDLKILVSKFLAGWMMFPAIVFAIGIASGLVFFLLINIAAFLVPEIGSIQPLAGLASLWEISLYGIVHCVLGLLWYAPFFAWVAGLSAIFGRWSLPLAFVIPGLLAIVENIVFLGKGPRGGYIWEYLSRRWNFGMSEEQAYQMVANPGLFHANVQIGALVSTIDWLQMAIGLGFAAAVIWLAAEYRRRRLT